MSQKPGRREFIIAAAAGVSALMLAPGVRLMEVARAAMPGNDKTAGANPNVRWGLLIDTTKCATGCNDCVSACNKENGLATPTRKTDAQWIRKVEIEAMDSGGAHSLPMLCQHCAEPPCVDVCPTGASFKRADGIVLVDKHSCIGCRYCMMACPYEARSFIHEALAEQNPDVPRGKGTVESCTLCVHRIDRGETSTACSEACPHEAIVFGDINDPQSKISMHSQNLANKNFISQDVLNDTSVQLRADLALNTGVRYQGL